jgi:hypothetical protein
VGAPCAETEQNGSIRIEDLAKVITFREGSRLTEKRLVPFKAARHVAYPYDRRRALLCTLLRETFLRLGLVSVPGRVLLQDGVKFLCLDRFA